MLDDEPVLSACMQKLKIIRKPRHVKIYRDDDLPLKLNPFARRQKVKPQSYTSIFGPTCSCKKIHVRNTTTFKRSTSSSKSKVLRDSAFMLTNNCKHVSKNKSRLRPSNDCVKDGEVKPKLFGENLEQHDFKSIIAGCEKLTLTAEDDEPSYASANFRDTRSTSQQRTEPKVNTSSCSQQAMVGLSINPPCDVTIDELASYFETFVHIPKKMSSMAEMMYI